MKDDAEYYLSLNNENINRISERREIYNNFMNLLVQFKNHLSSIQNSFNKALFDYKNGGYINDGVTLDNGTLDELIKIIDNNISVISDTINNISNEINQMNSQINSLQKLNQELLSQ